MPAARTGERTETLCSHRARIAATVRTRRGPCRQSKHGTPSRVRRRDTPRPRERGARTLAPMAEHTRRSPTLSTKDRGEGRIRKHGDAAAAAARRRATRSSTRSSAGTWQQSHAARRCSCTQSGYGCRTYAAAAATTHVGTWIAPSPGPETGSATPRVAGGRRRREGQRQARRPR